jgi:hypothetical protein
MSKDLLFGLKVPATGLPNVPTELTNSRTPSGFKRNLQQYLKIFGVHDDKYGEFLQQNYTGALMYFSGGRWAPEYNDCVLKSVTMFATLHNLPKEKETALLEAVRDAFARNDRHIQQEKQRGEAIKSAREARDGELRQALLEKGLSWKSGPFGSAGTRKGGAATEETASSESADVRVSKMLDVGIPEEQIAHALQEMILSTEHKEAKQVSRLTGEQSISAFMASIGGAEISTPQQLMARKQIFCPTAQQELIRCKSTAEELTTICKKFCEQQKNRVVIDALQQFNQLSSSDIHKVAGSPLCLENGVTLDSHVLIRTVCKSLKRDIEAKGGIGQVRNQVEQNFLNFQVRPFSRYDSVTGKRTEELPNVDSIVRQIDDHISILSEFDGGAPDDSQKVAVFRKAIQRAKDFPSILELSQKLEEQINQSKLAEVMEISPEALAQGAEATIDEIQARPMGYLQVIQLAKAIWLTVKTKNKASRKVAAKEDAAAAEDEDDELQTANLAKFGGGHSEGGKSGKGGKGRRKESHENTSTEDKSGAGTNKSKPAICRFYRSPDGCKRGQMCIYSHQAQASAQTQQTSNKVDSQKCYICAWKKLVPSQPHYFKDAQFHTAAEIKEYTRSPEYKTAMDKRREKRAAKYKANGAAAAAEDSDGSASE